MLNAECLEVEDGSLRVDEASERLREIGVGLASKVNGTRLMRLEEENCPGALSPDGDAVYSGKICITG